MKKLALITTMCIAIAGCGSDTDKVKNGILEFNKTITVGQALDNWKSCESKSWEEFSAENGVKVVQFTCNHKIKEYIEKAKSGVPEEINNGAIYLDVVSYIEKFQFTINKDDTFQIHNVSAETQWSDGEKVDGQQKPMEELETAYSNKLSFDPEELNYLGSGQFAFAMKFIKPGEKYKKIAQAPQPSVEPQISNPAPVAQEPVVQPEVVEEQKSWQPSFDCAKASTFVEKSICSERILGSLDGAMSENYQHMMASDIGDGARADLKSTQKQWMSERNKCTSIQCVEIAYRKRIDEICEYPVISGVHPICTYSNEIK